MGESIRHVSLVETLARSKGEETELEGQSFTTRKLGYGSTSLAGSKKFMTKNTFSRGYLIHVAKGISHQSLAGEIK